MKTLSKPFFVLLILLIFFSAENLFSQETKLMVRALANDAKFIGSSIGGAKIIIRDAETGEILDEGITEGSTGDTQQILLAPRERYQQVTDENTAGFEAKLDLEKPTFVTVEVHAPVNKKQAKVISSTQLWVIPGKNITGDGLVINIPGFVVDVLSPQTHETISPGTEIEIKANIVMTCGCPVTENGTWDSSGYEIKAFVTSNSAGEAQELKLIATDKPSTFSANVELEQGNYEIAVYAFDPKTGNTGLDKVNIIIN